VFLLGVLTVFPVLRLQNTKYNNEVNRMPQIVLCVSSSRQAGSLEYRATARNRSKPLTG
jgi:hypothetical protein